jgi:sensor histidine kinase YesM
VSKHGDEQLRRLAIIIRPPFWDTWWFIVLATLLAGTAGYTVFKWRERMQEKKLELAVLNQELTEMEMKALHAQMNPHFIFNCLNSILGMIIYGQNEDAYRYLNKFARLIRENFDHSKRPFITLQQNIDYLHNYLRMEQLRFSNFEYEMKVDERLNAGEIMIAPMLIQPLAENAIWHGLQAVEDKKQLKISFSRNTDYLVCEIEDNGIGIRRASADRSTTQQHLSIGIDNIQKRIGLLQRKYNTECIISFTDKSDKGEGESGTIVTLTWKII